MIVWRWWLRGERRWSCIIMRESQIWLVTRQGSCKVLFVALTILLSSLYWEMLTLALLPANWRGRLQLARSQSLSAPPCPDISSQSEQSIHQCDGKSANHSLLKKQSAGCKPIIVTGSWWETDVDRDNLAFILPLPARNCTWGWCWCWHGYQPSQHHHHHHPHLHHHTAKRFNISCVYVYCLCVLLNISQYTVI